MINNEDIIESIEERVSAYLLELSKRIFYPSPLFWTKPTCLIITILIFYVFRQCAYIISYNFFYLVSFGFFRTIVLYSSQNSDISRDSIESSTVSLIVFELVVIVVVSMKIAFSRKCRGRLFHKHVIRE